MTRRRKHILMGAVVLVLFVSIYAVFFPLPFQHRLEYRSLVWLECRYTFGVTAPGIDTLYFTGIEGDSCLSGLTPIRAEAEQVQQGQGFWYSHLIPIHFCRGRMLTTARVAQPDTLLENLRPRLKKFFQVNQATSAALLAFHQQMDRHLIYYMSTHDVIDEGYNDVADYQTRKTKEVKRLQRQDSLLKFLSKTSNPELLYLADYSYRSVTRDGLIAGKPQPCYRKKRWKNGWTVELQDSSKRCPKGTVSLGYPLINLMAFSTKESPRRVYQLSCNKAALPDSISQERVTRQEGRAWKTDELLYGTSLVTLPLAEGALVVDHRGVLIGLASASGIIPIK